MAINKLYRELNEGMVDLVEMENVSKKAAKLKKIPKAVQEKLAHIKYSASYLQHAGEELMRKAKYAGNDYHYRSRDVDADGRKELARAVSAAHNAVAKAMQCIDGAGKVLDAGYESVMRPEMQALIKDLESK